MTKRLKGEYDTKMDAISSQLHALSLQFTEEETKKQKAGTSSAYAWCTKCFQSGHSKDEYPALKASVNRIEVTSEGREWTTKYYLESEVDNVYTIGGGSPKDLMGRAMPQLPTDGSGRQKSYTLVADASLPPAPYVRRVPICYNCGEPGHTSYTCPHPRKQGDGKGARLCMICQLEGHLATSCPVVLAAKSVLSSIKGAASKPAMGTDSTVRLISIVEADDEASEHEGETWEHAEELPSGVEEMVDACYKVSTRTEKRQERLKALKDKRSKKTDSDEKSSAKPNKEYDRTHPNLFFPKVTEDDKQQLEAEEKKEVEEALKKDLVIVAGLRTIDILRKQLADVRPEPSPEEVKAAEEKCKARLVELEERPPTPRVTVEQLTSLPTEKDGAILPFNIKKEVWNCPVHTTVGALLSNHNVYQKELKGLFVRKRRARQLLSIGDVVDVKMIFEDLGQPEVCLAIMGCSIPASPLDGGSGVNVILEATVHKLGI
ncbi:unnamed protein product [Calypogeia fissa]